MEEEKTDKMDTQTTQEETQNSPNEQDLQKEEKKRVIRKPKKDKSDGKIEELEQKLAEKNDQYLRLHAEFDNYRKRTLKEKMELTRSAGESLLINILPVMDDFERALQSISATTDVEALKGGVELIHKRFGDFLKTNGIKEIEAREETFDTDLHEAITKIPAPTEELKGKVVDVIQKGYMLNDKVIRFAKVVVGE
ncbi:MAG TPA: nucleotide exchange factor GrpE [Prolixibacteraceae bacterium]|nr:nucleotide exchange factor GrpE [Prolixibacteraceae bacterium]